MTRFNPFRKVSCTYGAPMGRCAGKIDPDAPLCAQHGGGSQGYDRGGAYWGTPHNIWAVWNRGDGANGCVYVRAWSRDEAIRKAKEE